MLLQLGQDVVIVFHLLWKQTSVFLSEVAHQLLLLAQLVSHSLEFALEKLRGTCGLFRPHLKIVINEKLCQFGGDLSNLSWIFTLKRNLEGSRRFTPVTSIFEIDSNILSHDFNCILEVC